MYHTCVLFLVQPSRLRERGISGYSLDMLLPRHKSSQPNNRRRENRKGRETMTTTNFVELSLLDVPLVSYEKNERGKKDPHNLTSTTFSDNFLPSSFFFVEAALDMLHNVCYTYTYSRKDSFIHSTLSFLLLSA